MTEITTGTVELSEQDTPVILTNIHILQAMAATDPNKNHGVESWYLEFDGVTYPLKWIIARAAGRATNDDVDSREFHTDDAKEVAQKLGFKIINKS